MIDLPFAIFFLFIIWIFAGVMVVVPIVAILILVAYSFYIQAPLKQSIEEGHASPPRRMPTSSRHLWPPETVKIFGAEACSNIAGSRRYPIFRPGAYRPGITNSMSSLASYIQRVVTVGLVIVGVYQISGRAGGDHGGMIAAVMLSRRHRPHGTALRSLDPL